MNALLQYFNIARVIIAIVLQVFITPTTEGKTAVDAAIGYLRVKSETAHLYVGKKHEEVANGKPLLTAKSAWRPPVGFVAALFVDGKVVTGLHHGEAYSKLTDGEKQGNLLSGFLDRDNHKFIMDDKEIYLKKIFLIRHADSNGNWDDPISDIGRMRATKTKEHLMRLNLFNSCQCFCSPFRRCIETAEILVSQFSTNPQLARKLNYESEEDFNKRIIEALEKLPEKSVLISHSDVIQNMLKLVDTTVSDVPNCAISCIENNKAIWVNKLLHEV